MSLTPRASVFWADDIMPGARQDYFEDEDGEYGGEDEEQLLGEEDVHDGRTPVSAV